MTHRVPALGDGAEFDHIRDIWRRLGDRGEALGDDAAIVEVGAVRLAVSVDLAVEDRHFRRAWLEPAELGWRCAAAALSDLAAVAAEPLGLLASVGVPADQTGRFLEDLMEGVAHAGASVGAKVWGGDLVRSDRVVIDVIVVGTVAQPLLRSGASPGDQLWVTGRLGGPHEAVAAWSAGGTPTPTLRERYVHPVPRVREARWLQQHGATALIDVSDGLSGDVTHLAAASGVACEVSVEKVPIHAGVAAWESAVVGGEEYELLAALPPRPAEAEALASEFSQRFGIPLTYVGHVTDGAGVSWLRDGVPVTPDRGFSHF